MHSVILAVALCHLGFCTLSIWPCTLSSSSRRLVEEAARSVLLECFTCKAGNVIGVRMIPVFESDVIRVHVGVRNFGLAVTWRPQVACQLAGAGLGLST